MVETISPVVYGSRTRWIGAVVLHAVGAAATAAAFGAALGAAGALLGAPWGRAGALVVAVIAIAYALREGLGVRVPIPQLRRQVPDWWRTYFGRALASFLYGAGLGVGVFTFLGHGTVIAVAAVAAATGRPWLGAVVMAPFGLARGLAPLTAIRSRDPEDGRRLVDRLASMPGGIRRGANTVALVAIVAAAAAWAWRIRGGWGSAAAAALAVTFAWAAVAKTANHRRWRGTIADHGLPGLVERAAGWAVPAAEAIVAVLVVAGLARAAAGLALGLLTLFSLGLVRSAALHGWSVPCGCFGGAFVDVRGALARNLLLGAVAVTAWVASGPDPALRAPAPEPLPAILAVGAVAAAAGTAWRAVVWLGRGRA
jgi:hypothetical protein